MKAVYHEVEFQLKQEDLIVFAAQKSIDVNSFTIKYINDLIMFNQPEIHTDEGIIALAEYVADNVQITEDDVNGTIEVFLPANYIPTEK